jgi:Zn-dependent peptidase ImmA (M78 family)
MTARNRGARVSTVMARLKREIANDPSSFIENLSDKMVRNLGKTEPPFQTEAFEYATLAGAKVLEADITSSGLLSVFNGRIIIEINRHDPPERKNYTVCHEVGHIEFMRAARILPPVSSKRKFRNPEMQHQGTTQIEERLVEKFAENLLMPKVPFRKKAEAVAPSLENAMLLAKTFRTSLSATLRRIVSLRVWRCIIIWGIPEKMVVDGDWAVRIQEFRSSASHALGYPRHKHVWWAGEQFLRTSQSASIVKDMVMIEGKNWRFEGLREGHFSRSGVREDRVMAMLFPPPSA